MRYFLVAATFVVLLGAAVALYEEQAGQIDWYKQNIGSVTHAEFAFRGRERVFVATAEDVVASLDTRDGSITWRQVLEEGDGIDALVLVPRPASVVTLSRQGRVVRSWHALDGTLQWEETVADSSSQQKPLLLVLPDVTRDGSSEIAVLSASRIKVVSASSGKLVWTAELAGSVLIAAVGSEEQPTIMVAVSEGTGVHLKSFDAESGKELSSKLLAPEVLQASMSSKVAAAITGDGKLCGMTFTGSSPSCQRLSALAPELSGPARLGEFLDDTTVALLLADGIVLVNVGDRISVASTHPGFTAARGFEGLAGLAGVSAEGALTTRLWDLSASTTIAENAKHAQLLTANGQPIPATSLLIGSRRVGEYRRQDTIVNRWLVSVGKDSLHFLEGSQIMWTREEALSRVQNTLFLDLPASTAEAEAQLKERRPTLTDRVNAEVLTIKSTLGFIQPDEVAQLKDLNLRLSTHLLPHRDANGFRKIVVALSESGTLFALHSGDGRVLWRLQLDDADGNSRLFPWRSSHDSHQAPEVLVLSRKGGRASFAVVNAHSGKVVEAGSLPGSIRKVLELPRLVADGVAEQHALILVSEDLSVSVLPAASAARMLLADKPLHFWRHDEDEDTLSGFHLAPGAAACELLWTVAFGGPSNTILHIASKDPSDHVYTYAKVLGDRSLKLKYLNPNAIFVVSGPPDGAPASAVGDATMTVHLIDTITGQILYRQSLEGAKGPARAVLGENWAVFSYLSTSNQRNEIAVLEFYDAQQRSLSIPSLLFDTQNSTRSSYTPTPLEVMHQSYFTQIGLNALSVTKTRRGITSKQLLLGTDSNQVYLMDKRFVDPRRPKGTPTAEEKAEMLPPYAAELVFSSQLYASHKEVVEGLRGIVTSPANLESTTLMLAYGIDLFFTRVQPSKTFDLLPDDFPYAMLLLVTAVLSIGAFILKRMDSANSIKRKWL